MGSLRLHAWFRPVDFPSPHLARTLADVLLPDDTNVNHELVKEGWWYRKYALGDTVLEELEKAAREAKKGLWADPQPVPPWEWRKEKKMMSGALNGPVSLQEFIGI